MALLELERTISASSIVVAARDQISSDLAGEAVILHLNSGKYYGLDPVGARIWSLIKEPKMLSDVRDALLDEYEVEANSCERDLMELVAKLAAEGLVEVKA